MKQQLFVLVLFLICISCHSQEDLMVVTKNKKQGILDIKTKTLITPTIYDEIYPDEFQEFYFTAKKDSLMTLLDMQGKPMLPIMYESVSICGKNNNMLLAEKNNKIGLFDRSGKQIRPFIYTQIEFLGNNVTSTQVYVLKTDTSCVIIDDDFNIISTDCKTFQHEFGQKYVRIFIPKTKPNGDIEYLMGVKDVETGDTIVRPQYNMLQIFPNYFQVSNYIDNDVVNGILNMKGEVIAPLIYHSIWGSRDNNRDKVILYLNKNLENKTFILDILTERIKPFDYQILFTYDNILKISQNNKIGLYDTKTENVIVPCEYDNIIPTYSGSLIYTLQKGTKYGVASTQGVILSCEFDNVNFDDQLITYLLGDKWGAVNIEGEERLKPIYDDIQLDQADTVAFVTKAGKQSTIDLKTLKELPQITFGGKMMLAKNFPVIVDNEDYKYGLINGKTGEIIVPLTNDYIEIEYEKDLAFIFRNDTSEILNLKTLKYIVPFKSKNVNLTVSPSLVQFERNGMEGLYDIHKQTEVVSPIYESVRLLNDNLFLCKKDGKFGIVELNTGQIYIPFEYDSMVPFDDFFP